MTECNHWDKGLILVVDDEFLKGQPFIRCLSCGFEFNNPMWLSKIAFDKGRKAGYTDCLIDNDLADAKTVYDYTVFDMPKEKDKK